MGYYTHFNLEVLNVPTPEAKEEVLRKRLANCSSDEERLKVFHEVEESFVLLNEYEIIKQLREQNQNAEYVLDDDGSSYQSGKWYDWQKDMIEFSKKFPDVLFVLSGEGEESGDIWKAYIRNGKIQHEKATVVIAEYDPAKLL